MNRSNLRRVGISLLLTMALGPGAGHLYLRKFQRALSLIATTLFFAFQLTWQILKTVPKPMPADMNPSEVLQSFNRDHSGVVFIFDAIFAAIWAFALVDAYILARQDNGPSEETDATENRDDPTDETDR